LISYLVGQHVGEVSALLCLVSARLRRPTFRVGLAPIGLGLHPSLAQFLNQTPSFGELLTQGRDLAVLGFPHSIDGNLNGTGEIGGR
jgi:hypothetical protein